MVNMPVRTSGFTVFLFTFVIGMQAASTHRNSSCGIDRSPIDVVFEGLADIENYPFLGYLFYPMRNKRFTTVVVLVTRQIVIGTATEIDKLPKKYFREKVKVVLGSGCSGRTLSVRDYSYHPDYGADTLSALAMIQLELDDVKMDLYPICPPPSYVIEPQFYAMTLSDDCSKPLVKLYEMTYVDPAECRTYYRRAGLDLSTIWPTHTACARARHGGECLWRSGAALVLRQGVRWHLVGFGVYGPGCEAPARFLDYGMYQQWVRHSVLRIGRPTVTRIGDQKVILRRSMSNLQRFGPCDGGEMKTVLYSDRTKIQPDKPAVRKVRYNVTIYAQVEYSCVMFQANSDQLEHPPKLRLRRWCAGKIGLCTDLALLEIDFFVEIVFVGSVTYDVVAYGYPARNLDPARAMVYANKLIPYPKLPSSKEIQDLVKKQDLKLWYQQKWDDFI